MNSLRYNAKIVSLRPCENSLSPLGYTPLNSSQIASGWNYPLCKFSHTAHRVTARRTTAQPAPVCLSLLRPDKIMLNRRETLHIRLFLRTFAVANEDATATAGCGSAKAKRASLRVPPCTAVALWSQSGMSATRCSWPQSSNTMKNTENYGKVSSLQEH